MRSLMVWSAVIACAVPGAAFAEDAIKSGLEVGKSAPPFNVRDITGPNKGKTLCYRWQYGARPVVAIFTRTMSDDLTSLVKEINATVAANKSKKMAAFTVVLTEDADKTEEALKSFAKDAKIDTVPLTLMEGVAGPPAYKIAKDAEVTVLMWKGLKVQANHAFAKGKLDKNAIKKIIEDTSKILE